MKRSKWLTFEPRGDLFRVVVGHEKLYVAVRSRIKLLRSGVHARGEALARDYGVPHLRHQLRNKTVIDAGANVGEFSLYAAAYGAKVHAFEPDPLVFKALTKNAKIRPFKVYPSALWNATGSAPLTLSTSDASSTLITQRADSITVDTITLDDFMNQSGISDLFLLKADVEGAEPELLEGARHTLKRTAWLTVDCGPERNDEDTVDACWKILKSYFDIRQLDSKRCVLLCRAKWLKDPQNQDMLLASA